MKIDKWYHMYGTKDNIVFEEAHPQRMRGRWVEFDYPWFKCSQCGAVREKGAFLENYCPNCGAEMEAPE